MWVEGKGGGESRFDVLDATVAKRITCTFISGGRRQANIRRVGRIFMDNFDL